jgi:hypothetical protein
MRVKIIVLFVLIVLLFAYVFSFGLGYASLTVKNLARLVTLLIAGGLLSIGLYFAAKRGRSQVWIYIGLFVLAGLFLPTAMLVGYFLDPLPQPFRFIVQLVLFLLPSLALVAAALLLNSGLNLYYERRNARQAAREGSLTQPKQAGRMAALCFLLSALVIAKLLHNQYWLLVWDNTYDPIEYFWLPVPVLAAYISGLLLIIAQRGWGKLAGLYALLLPALLIAVSLGGMGVDFRLFTEERAGRVSQAIEAYQAREGRYPGDLGQLTPRYLLSLPGPVILYGQGWCYDGGEGYYRLGAVDRDHWSSPELFGHLYAAQGEVPQLFPICEAEITALNKSYEFFNLSR